MLGQTRLPGLVMKPGTYRSKPDSLSSSHILIISAPSLIIGFLGFEIVGVEFARRGYINGEHTQVAMVEAQAISATGNIYSSLTEGCVRLKDRIG